MADENQNATAQALPAAVVPVLGIEPDLSLNPAPVPPAAGATAPGPAEPEPVSTIFDPTNPREFDPTVVLLHLERDGVVVEGFIDPFTGDGCHELLIRLQDELTKARSREDGAAHVQVGIQPDPNALRRQRAAASGHDIDPETHRCLKCGCAEWWCLDGNPCEPRSPVVETAPAEVADGEAQIGGS